MKHNNLLAFLCAAIGTGLSIFQTVLSIPSLYLELNFLHIISLHNNELFTVSCIVIAIAVLAAISGLCALLRKGKGFYVWGLAGCSTAYISAICVYISDLQAGEAVKMTFQSWHKTYLVWALLFLAAAVFAFLDHRAYSQQDNDDSDTAPSPETPLNTDEHTSSIPTDPDTLTEQAHIFLSKGNFHEAERYYREALKHTHENSAAYLGQLMAQLRVRNIDELRTANISLAENSLFQLAMLFADDDQRIILQKCLDD